MSIKIQHFFDPDTYSFTYLVIDQKSRQAAVIDPVLKYDQAASKTSNEYAKNLLAEIEEQELTLSWILETHVHADHLTSAQYLKQATGAKIAISKHITQVQKTFNSFYEFTDSLCAKALDFDHLTYDGELLDLGQSQIKVIHTPGHTPSCSTYLIDDAAFVGDTLFMPDFGTARCDFPDGNANQLYQSIQKILSLPDDTRIFMCHDYMPGGRELLWQTSVLEQKNKNIHIHQGITEEEYTTMRNTRDAELPFPKLLLPALQVNIRAGKLPKDNATNSEFLKFPLNKFIK